MEYDIAGNNYFFGVIASSVSVGTSWAKYSYTFTMPTYSGLSPNGTGDWVGLRIWMPVNTTFTFSTWGWQLEAGSVATPFTTASGTLQGELALCQRYLPAWNGTSNQVLGVSANTANTRINIGFSVTPRVAPTGTTYSSLSHFGLSNPTFGSGTPTAISFVFAGVNSCTIGVDISAGSPTISANLPVQFSSVNAAASLLFTGCEL